MKTFLSLLLIESVLGAQVSLVRYTPPVPSSGTIIGSYVSVVNIAQGYGAQTCGTPGHCIGNYPKNSTFYSRLFGAADWRIYTGVGGNEFLVNKNLTSGSRHVSDLTILPTSSQPAIDTYHLGLYLADPSERGLIDYSNPAHPQTIHQGGNADIATYGHYINCYSGRLVSNCGDQVTMDVTNTIAQQYYLAVGAGGANGQLRVHLSDSSAADYVWTQTEATGQTEELFTFTIRSVSAGAVATFTWTAGSLEAGSTAANVGILAAGIGGQTSGNIDPTTLPQRIAPTGYPAGFPYGTYGAQVEAPNMSAVPAALPGHTVMLTHVNGPKDAANLQSALNTALASGYTGTTLISLGDGFDAQPASGSTLTLSNPAGRSTSGYVVIQAAILPTKASDGTQITSGQRPDPSDTFHAHISGMAGSPSSHEIVKTDSYSSTIHHIVFSGIEFIGTSGYGYGIMEFSGGGPAPSQLNHDFIISQCWIHGIRNSDGSALQNGTDTGLLFDVNNGGIYDSYFSNFGNSGGNESKAISWSTSTGPITIRNDHIEARTQAYICCATGPVINTDEQMSNLTQDHNYFTKDFRERGKGLGGLGYGSEKEHGEVKSSYGYTFTNNVLDKSWVDAQGGDLAGLQSHNSNGDNLWLGIANVLIANNYGETANGFNMSGLEDHNFNSPYPTTMALLAHSIKFFNNWVFQSATIHGGGAGYNPTHCIGLAQVLPDVIVDHNTCSVDPSDAKNNLTDYGITMPSPTGIIIRPDLFRITNNDVYGGLNTSPSCCFDQIPAGITISGNIWRGPNPLNDAVANFHLSSSATYSWYWNALPQSKGGLGNPKGIIGIATNYVEGIISGTMKQTCLIGDLANSLGSTCTTPPALTYPNPAIGADRQMLMNQYCAVVTGNRSDLPCTPPHSAPHYN